MAVRFLGSCFLAGGITLVLFWTMTALIAIEDVRTESRYPERALARGIEGRVLIEFTISASGSVQDARVIASEPGNVLDKAALDAVRRWRDSPKIENGKPTEPRGVRIAIPFRRDGRHDT